jgi:hypothetical protein
MMLSFGIQHSDAALNLIWVALCVSALLWQLLSQSRRTGFSSQVLRRDGLAVFLAAVALFPCISASDDRVRLRDLDAAQTTQSTVQKGIGDNLTLSLQLEDLEHAQAATVFSLLLFLSFLLMVRIEDATCIPLARANSASRGPPSF